MLSKFIGPWDLAGLYTDSHAPPEQGAIAGLIIKEKKLLSGFTASRGRTSLDNMSFLRRIVKGGDGDRSPTDEERERLEAVERICSRLQQASLLEDRRSAAQALKSVSKQYQRVGGAPVAMGWLISSLFDARKSARLVGLPLGLLFRRIMRTRR